MVGLGIETISFSFLEKGIVIVHSIMSQIYVLNDTGFFFRNKILVMYLYNSLGSTDF